MKKPVFSEKRIILASGSPRRKEILEQLGMEFEVIPSEVDEKMEGDSPAQIVENLSRQKALDVLNHKVKGDCIVIGSDTIVVSGDKVLGKPESGEEAYAMIRRIQGTMHQVYTGVAIFNRTDSKITSEIFSEHTDVYVNPMTSGEIASYIARGESMDKAGAYGIQGYFAAFVQKIEGEYSTVLGLPIAGLYEHMKNVLKERKR